MKEGLRVASMAAAGPRQEVCTGTTLTDQAIRELGTPWQHRATARTMENV